MVLESHDGGMNILTLEVSRTSWYLTERICRCLKVREGKARVQSGIRPGEGLKK